MPNLRIIHDNAADRATSIAANSTAGALVPANMLTERKSMVHRSTATGVVYTLTWAAGETIAGIALPATNLTAAATIRAQLYSDTACTVQIADTGVQYACAGLNLGMWDWSIPLNSNGFAFGGASKSSVWFDAAYFAKGCKITLSDAGNAAGYIDCARIVAGGYWSPTWNAKFGVQVMPVDLSPGKRNDADDYVSLRKQQHDQLTLDLELMPEADRARLMMIIRATGVARNIFLSLLPNDTSAVAEQDGMIYGHRSANSPIAFQIAKAFSHRIELEGW